MRPIRLEKSTAFLFAIVVIVMVAGALFYLQLRSDPISESIKNDRIIKILFIFEDKGKPLSTEALFYYPTTHKAAIFDVPGDVGLIIKSLNRVDRIDKVYKPRSPGAYRTEVENLLSTDIPYYITMDLDGLSSIADLFDGVELFVPNPVEMTDPANTVLLPSGSVVLDGLKMKEYVSYVDPNEPELERLSRTQKSFQSVLHRIGQKATLLHDSRVYSMFRRNVRTNLSDRALKRMMDEFAQIDTDKIVPQHISGNRKKIDDQSLLFPYYDGELVKDIVKQTLSALANSKVLPEEERIVTIEILNGTKTSGLAKKTADLFQSFGYDVVSFDNADTTDTDKTAIVDRIGKSDIAASLADVIKCKNIKTQADSVASDTMIDFTIVLGKDFNGRYCIQ
jgi:polyisoprenyl-teichoic acid--peptidoglycan teichoic acid transferase